MKFPDFFVIGFPKSGTTRVGIYFQEKMQEDTQGIMEEIYKFLELKETQVSGDVYRNNVMKRINQESLKYSTIDYTSEDYLRALQYLLDKTSYFIEDFSKLYGGGQEIDNWWKVQDFYKETYLKNND